jgi:hypothetical protein
MALSNFPGRMPVRITTNPYQQESFDCVGVRFANANFAQDDSVGRCLAYLFR